MRRIVAALLIAVPFIASAQGTKKEPNRPLLVAGADTNDARAYYDLGLASLRSDPKVAAAAFHWASKLDPASADALYAHRVALLLNQPPNTLQRYWSADRSTMRRKEIKAIDSLYLRALTINPFLYEKLERVLQDAVIRSIANASSGSAAEVEYAIDNYLRDAGPGESAFRAYTEGDFANALKYYASAISQSRDKYYYRTMRGRTFFQFGQPKDAIVELTLALQDMRKRDEKDLVYVYQSKALLEHSIGLANIRSGDRTGAKEAYGRALQEDLAYAPAHIALAYLALEAGDTATALSEYDLAVQLRGDEVAMRHEYGQLLAAAKKDADAEVQLKKAVELNPAYAAPHVVLAAMYDRQAKPELALESYKAYLARARRGDPRRTEAENKVKALVAR